MTNKLVFIVDSSEQYLNTKVREIMKEWGFSQENYKTLEEWKIGSASINSLFGSPKAVHLDLSNDKNLTKFKTLIKEDKKVKESFKKENWFGSGLIITATKAQGIKPIETLIINSNGSFFKKKKSEEIKLELFKELKLSKNIEFFLDEYSGEDYELLINCANAIRPLSDEEKKKLTIDEILVFLPVKKGAIPPFEFVNDMIRCNTTTALDKLRRVLENHHALVAMLFIKRKIEEIYHDKILRVSNINSFKERAEIIGANAWAIKNLPDTSNLKLEVLESLVYLVNNAEDSLKGGTHIQEANLFLETIVTKIIIALKYNIKVY